jgi:hypothetical protein
MMSRRIVIYFQIAATDCDIFSGHIHGKNVVFFSARNSRCISENLFTIHRLGFRACKTIHFTIHRLGFRAALRVNRHKAAQMPHAGCTSTFGRGRKGFKNGQKLGCLVGVSERIIQTIRKQECV